MEALSSRITGIRLGGQSARRLVHAGRGGAGRARGVSVVCSAAGPPSKSEIGGTISLSWDGQAGGDAGALPPDASNIRCAVPVSP